METGGDVTDVDGRTDRTARLGPTADSPRFTTFLCVVSPCVVSLLCLPSARARRAGQLVAPVPRGTGGICTRPAASLTPPPRVRTLLLRQDPERNGDGELE